MFIYSHILFLISLIKTTKIEKAMGGSLSEFEKYALTAEYCGEHGVVNTGTDVMWNPDALQAGNLIDREDPNVKTLYKSFL